MSRFYLPYSACFPLLLLLFTTATLSAQQPYSRYYDTIGGLAGSATLVSDSAIYVAWGSYMDWTNDRGVFHWMKTVPQGNVLQFQSDSNAYWDFAQVYKAMKEKNGKIYTGYTAIMDSNREFRHFLLRMDKDLGVEKRRRIFFMDSSSGDINDMVFDSDSTFLITGYHHYETLDTNFLFNWGAYIARYDTAFNLLWERSIADTVPFYNQGYNPLDITIDPQDGVLISGEAKVTNNFGGLKSRYSFAMRFRRSTGQLLWRKHFFGPVESRNFLTTLRDSNSYHFLQVQADSFYVNINAYDWNLFFRTGTLDFSGRLTPEKTYGPYDSYYRIARFLDLIKTADQNLYTVGHYTTGVSTYNKSRAMAFKYSPQGDNLWSRFYNISQDTMDALYCWSFAQAPDSGYVHSGVYIDAGRDIDPSRGQYSYLLKTDKYGCLVPGCEQVGLPERDQPRLSWSLYPQPARQELYLKRLATQPATAQARYQLYDMQGRRVGAGPLPPVDRPIAVGHLAPGLYGLHVLDGRRIMFQERFVVGEH